MPTIRHLLCLTCIILATALLAPAQVQPEGTPESKPQASAVNERAKLLTEAEIIKGLFGGISNTRMAYLVGQYGVAFSMTSESEERLRSAGADDKLIAGIRKAAEHRLQEERKQDQQQAFFVFVPIPPGEFEMGCSSGDVECEKDERPQHHVRISRGFEMGKYLVTQAMWVAVMDDNPSLNKEADKPVERVSWNNVQNFLQRMNAKNDGYRYRLPTEAEWEYAARAGSTASGSGNLYRVWQGTHPVGQGQPNAWGLYDMLDNVWQWVQDWYDSKYYQQSPGTDPQGPFSGQHHVLRGGSWYSNTRSVRVSYRSHGQNSNLQMGFRCVREEQKEAEHNQAEKEARRQEEEVRLAIWTDTRTGLMWAKYDNGSSVNWNQANSYCSSLSLAGYRDWRLPTIDELVGIYDPTEKEDYIMGGIRGGGDGVREWKYWSSSTRQTQMGFSYRPTVVTEAETFSFFLSGSRSFSSLHFSLGRALCVRRFKE